MSKALTREERIEIAVRQIEPLTDEQIRRVCQIMRGQLVQKKDEWDV